MSIFQTFLDKNQTDTNPNHHPSHRCNQLTRHCETRPVRNNQRAAATAALPNLTEHDDLSVEHSSRHSLIGLINEMRTPPRNNTDNDNEIIFTWSETDIHPVITTKPLKAQTF